LAGIRGHGKPLSFKLTAKARRLAIKREHSRQVERNTRMEHGQIAFTAVYRKVNNGYVGFIEELPGVNSHGHTLDETREALKKLAGVVFEEERRETEELIAGKDVVREWFTVPIPRPSHVAQEAA
jgi:predicted RNase H-like HicB family nuclease